MNLGFWIFRLSILEFFGFANSFWTIWWWDIEEKIIKVFWRDPGQNGGFWEPFLVQLRFQFTVKCWKVDFLMSSKTKSCQSSREKLRMVRALPPDAPDLTNFNLNYQKTRFCEKLDFSRFTNRSLARRWRSPAADKREDHVESFRVGEEPEEPHDTL